MANSSRMVLGGLFGAALLLLGVMAFRSSTQSRTLALTAGELRVYEDELPAEAHGEIAQLRQQEYEIKVRALQNVLVRRLLEAEARKRTLTLEQLMEAEGRARVTPPTDADVRAFFEQKKANYQQPFEQIKERVRSDLTEERLRAGQRQFVQQMWQAASVEVLLPRPRTPMLHDRQRVRGNPQAPVMIVEFSDFQCPFCRRVQPALMALLAKYPQQVALSFRDYPIIGLHPMAHVSAQAARCAGAQGKFWEYHDLLFVETGRPDRVLLDKFAAQLQLDAKGFATCLDSAAQKQGVDSDFEDGARAGVSSTPVFFINGIYVSGAQPQEEFERIIERELKLRR